MSSRAATCCSARTNGRPSRSPPTSTSCWCWSPAEPVFSESQLARALIAAESAGIPARIALNKADLPQIDAARERLAPYRAMGVDVLEVALKARAGRSARDARAAAARASATLVLGPSGTGKSTLINLLVPDARRAGRRDLAGAQLRPPHDDDDAVVLARRRAHARALIDSPGFQEFGLRQIEPQQLPRLMPDLREHADGVPLLQLHAPARAGLRRARGARARRDQRVALPHLRRDLRRADAQRRW